MNTAYPDRSMSERVRMMKEFCQKVNGNRKPAFLDMIMNPWASKGNPHRCGHFIRTTGNQHGSFYEVTDNKGSVWTIDKEHALLYNCLSEKEIDILNTDIGYGESRVPMEEALWRCRPSFEEMKD